MSTKTSLPQEIIADILSRLPNKSLLRFQSVSKSWLSWISSLEFAKLRLRNRVFLLTLNRDLKLQPASIKFKSLHAETCCGVDNGKLEFTQQSIQFPDLRFVGSCNGLIAVVNYPCFDCFVVLNPTMSQFRELPILEPTPMGLGYFGLGYDSRIDDYKIIRGAISKIEIFSLKNKSWRIIEDPNRCYANDGGVYLNGFLHWLIGKYNGDECGYKYEMVRFNLAKEKFEDMKPLPNEIDHRNLNGDIKVIDGGLCVYTEWRAAYFAVWKMMKYGEHDSWRRVYQSRDDNICRFNRWNQFLYVTEAGNLLFESEGKCFVVYNPIDKTVEKLHVDDQEWYLAKGIVYMESFVAVKHGRLILSNIDNSTGKAKDSASGTEGILKWGLDYS